MGPLLVNLGCGTIAHPAWINLDLAPALPNVQRADFLRQLPFDSDSVDAVYHAHVLEHFDRDDAVRFLAENVRILRPGGTLRVVVPDLEELCRFYLATLDKAERGEPNSDLLYQWALLDLLDQMVRRRSGGEMIEFLDHLTLADKSALAARLPVDFFDYLMAAKPVEAQSFVARLRRAGVRGVARRLTFEGTRLRTEVVPRIFARIVGGARAARAAVEGAFRSTGEVHRWMYDRRSLGQALRAAGCRNIELRGPFDSSIPDFVTYELDTVGDRVRKPGSIFIEGMKGI
jgi:predicted SAM-dependent methyltransferase